MPTSPPLDSPAPRRPSVTGSGGQARRRPSNKGRHFHRAQAWRRSATVIGQDSWRSSFTSHMSTDARVPGVSDESIALNTLSPASMSSALSNC